MTEPFLPGREFAHVVDGLEPVTLQSAPAGREQTVSHAKRTAASAGEAAPSGGHYRRGEATWHLPAAELDRPPRPGDRITAGDGSEWTILEVVEAVGGARWQCRCRNLILAMGLSDRVTLQWADAWRKLPAGDFQPRWCDLLVNVPARIQPLESRPDSRLYRREDRETHVVYLAGPSPDVPAGECRILDEAGNVYTVVRLEKEDRIDVLVEVFVQRRP